MPLSAGSVVGFSPTVVRAHRQSRWVSCQLWAPLSPRAPCFDTLILSSHRGQPKVTESCFQLRLPLQSSAALALSWRGWGQVSGMYAPVAFPGFPSALGKCEHCPSPQTVSSFLPSVPTSLPRFFLKWHPRPHTPCCWVCLARTFLKNPESVFLLHRWGFSTEKQLPEKADNEMSDLLRAHLTPRTGWHPEGRLSNWAYILLNHLDFTFWVKSYQSVATTVTLKTWIILMASGRNPPTNPASHFPKQGTPDLTYPSSQESWEASAGHA